jgi:AAHS family 3-hydroxyphenylpropionic acid transporter
MASSATGGSKAGWVVAFCCLAAMGEGVDLQAPGVTLPVLGPLFHLASGEGFVAGFFSQKSLFLSISTFGLMIGAMIGGRASDLVGRKWVTVVSVALFGLLSALTGRSTSVEMLLWTRFLTGLGLGGALPSLIALAAETVAPRRRNTAVGCLYASMPAGGALVSLSSYAFANPGHWPYIYYLGGLVPALALPGLILGLPNLPPASSQRAASKPSISLALFGEGRAGRTSVLWLCFFCALVTQYIILGWLPTLLIAKGLTRPEASIVQIGFNAFSAMGSVVTGILIDRPSRATTTALVYLGAILALSALAAAPASLGLSLAVISLVGVTIGGTQTIAYALAPGVYPTPVRGTGVGFAVAAGRFGAAIGPLLAGAIMGAGAGAIGVLGVMVPLMVVAGVCAWRISRTTGPRAGLTADGAALAAQ